MYSNLRLSFNCSPNYVYFSFFRPSNRIFGFDFNLYQIIYHEVDRVITENIHWNEAICACDIAIISDIIVICVWSNYKNFVLINRKGRIKNREPRYDNIFRRILLWNSSSSSIRDWYLSHILLNKSCIRVLTNSKLISDSKASLIIVVRIDII